MFDVELRLPKAIAFVHSEATHGHKPFHSNVIIPLSTPINPGDSLVIGYIKEHNDPTRLFDATKKRLFDATKKKKGTGTLCLTQINSYVM